jgi:hypothetical protein
MILGLFISYHVRAMHTDIFDKSELELLGPYNNNQLAAKTNTYGCCSIHNRVRGQVAMLVVHSDGVHATVGTQR